MENKLEAGLAFSANIWPLNPQSQPWFLSTDPAAQYLWDNQLKNFGDRANLLALDLPGHGRSPGKSLDTVPDYTESVMAFLNELKIPGPIPAGQSLGGAITLQLLLDYPGRFPAGVLICTGAKLKVLPTIFETIEKDYPAFVEMKKQKWPSSPRTDPASAYPTLIG